ncbi:FAD-dependent monooxygenase [Bacillus safensis]|uniref:FAD-dependent monooxygenase n=1 Tax=Bacillus safensis TaxID=561879 RepID=UPI003664C157
MTALSKKQKQIAIIGGGPGGLTLALILQNYGIQTTIYEREMHDKSLERGRSRIECFSHLTHTHAL